MKIFLKTIFLTYVLFCPVALLSVISTSPPSSLKTLLEYDIPLLSLGYILIFFPFFIGELVVFYTSNKSLKNLFISLSLATISSGITSYYILLAIFHETVDILARSGFGALVLLFFPIIIIPIYLFYSLLRVIVIYLTEKKLVFIGDYFHYHYLKLIGIILIFSFGIFHLYLFDLFVLDLPLLIYILLTLPIILFIFFKPKIKINWT